MTLDIAVIYSRTRLVQIARLERQWDKNIVPLKNSGQDQFDTTSFISGREVLEPRVVVDGRDYILWIVPPA